MRAHIWQAGLFLEHELACAQVAVPDCVHERRVAVARAGKEVENRLEFDEHHHNTILALQYRALRCVYVSCFVFRFLVDISLNENAR